MKALIYIVVFISGIVAVMVLSDKAELTVLNPLWWLTVTPLCFYTGVAAATMKEWIR